MKTQEEIEQLVRDLYYCMNEGHVQGDYAMGQIMILLYILGRLPEEATEYMDAIKIPFVPYRRPISPKTLQECIEVMDSI